MATIILGCDSNGNDTACQNTVAEILKKAGHTVEKLSIGPTPFSKYGYTSKAKGKIGVYLMAASLVSVTDVPSSGWNFKYTYFGIRGDVSKLIKSQSDFNSKGIPKDHHGDCTNSYCDKWAGKTYPEINTIIKNKGLVTFGASHKELGNAIVSAMSGDSSSDSSDSNSSNSGGTVKEGIQKLLKHWDGEVECRIIGEKVYINKVREPQSNYHLLLQEGLNIFSDSVKITDVNPNTINYLVVRWSEGKITIKDTELINRFGTIKAEVNAVKKVTQTVSSSKTNSDDDSDDGDDSDDNSDSSSDSSTKTTVVNVPIKKYKDALAFANTEWNKIKRDNGHTIECQVPGSYKWRVGEWVKVVLPSFGENGYMYITKASHSDDGGDWTCNLTLQDYPPGWGDEESDSDDSSSSNTKTTNVSDAINQVVKEISKFTYSGSCSDASCIKSTKKGDCHALSDYIYTRLKKLGVSARIYQYKTSSSDNHRQVKYKDGSNWVIFPYSKSGIDHNFYTNSIPSGAEIYKS